MIKNIFIPERFGSYYIFPQRVIGLDITKTDIYATQTYFKGTRITIEAITHQSLEGIGTYQEKVAAALVKIAAQAGKNAIYFSSISSGLVIAKTIKLPFTSYEKIKMIIAYEIEPSLPFPAANAVIDFIITKTDQTEQSSEVFVVAVQKQNIDEHLALLKQANIVPQLLTVDMVALYTLYKNFTAQKQTSSHKNIVLLDVGNYETRMASIFDGQIKLLRTLPHGIVDQLKTISKQLTIALPEAHEMFVRFGLQGNSNTHFDQAIQNTMSNFIKDIGFTINSFAQQAGATSQEQTYKVILIGGSEIKGLHEFISRTLGIPCEPCKPNDFLYDHQLTMQPKQGSITPPALVSLGTSLSGWQENAFNLMPTEYNEKASSLINYQLLTAFLLSLLLIVGLWGMRYWQIRSLRSEAYDSVEQTIAELQETFPKSQELQEVAGETPIETLDEAVTIANTIVTQQEKLVNEFSSASRTALVTYLLELSSILDVSALGLKASKISITPERMIFSGSVAHLKDAPQIRQLLLQSPLFGEITPPEAFETTNFNATIALKKPRGST